ncbi:MAG: ABC transporter ATP-binding protein/permease [Ruminococcaceae bacterium]|nr:ABC transporter ATP-binding protein/permease [Oscillospiraceae bacterium]
MLKLSGIKKDYITASETVHALKGVDLCFRESEFVSILGPSGCGKTTLLNIIGGLDHYTEGDLIINGRSTKSYRDRDWDVYRNHRIGFIFQSYNLIPHQTVLGNVELALTISGIGREERVARAKEALDKVGLSGQYYKRPNQLSGGQCQRVAIARALVNDPEILLADEPTGALDTATSVQIMELIKEISKERLVIMVTHNPELAEKYSSRIIRLLDGAVTEDTNPLSEADEAAELKGAKKASKSASQNGKKLKTEKAKMSFFTAFRLSARNLISKKGRTVMVGFAGSIGIIGIALVLAFSAGIKGYIASMQDDMLSGNPIEISETGFSASALSSIMDSAGAIEKDKLKDKVYITSIIENLAEMSDSLERLFASNILTDDYIKYVLNMPKTNYEAMLVSYGLDISTGVFTDFRFRGGEESEHISIRRLIDVYTSVLGETEYAEYASFIPYLVPSLQQAPSSSEYILSQYELLGGSEIADDKDEIMLVLNPDEEISDLLLAAFGYYTQEEFLSIVDKAVSTEEGYEGGTHYREYFDYGELLGKEFVYYPTDTVFTKSENIMAQMMNGSYQYNSKLDPQMLDENGGLKLKVVGILTPKETVSYGCLTAGIYYTEALTEHILEENADSEYIDYILSEQALKEIGSKVHQVPNPDDPTSPIVISLNYSTVYSYTYRYDDPITPEDESVGEDGEDIIKSGMGIVSPKQTSMSPTSLMGGTSEDGVEQKRDTLVRNLGGNSVANNILIYPKSFEEKNLVTEYLDDWSDDDVRITVDGREIPIEERTKVTYTDTLELVIKMINTMIDVVSYALIAFTSVSLVVSTVMIGIITYVSVVERIKEIGVIRSLGGRKRDVSSLFNAETFIIGLLAGLLGVGVTYAVSAIVNVILAPIISYASIAALPVGEAVLLVIVSIALTLISGLIPARSAAKKDPVVALRTE